ncbi:MAG: ribulokinase [Bryobacteraceae bacterium]
MAIVAGVDFGTLSVRVSLFDSRNGRLGTATGDYPLHRSHDDPDRATQRPADHLSALERAMKDAVRKSGVDGTLVEAIAIDTTGSSVVPVGAGLEPIDDYYLWCDHRSWKEAGEITTVAHARGLEAIDWCGGTYSSEWGWAKLLHWLRHNPEKRGQFVSAFEHCDLIAAVLCGIHDVESAPRSICATGHKWMWNEALGGFPPEEFFTAVDPLLAGVRAKIVGQWGTSDKIAGHLSPEWAARLGLKAGIPIPIGALDAHWDAIASGIRLGDIVNVVGTSTCIMAICDETGLIPGVSGVVKGSIHPAKYGIEAGLSAVGDAFEAIARRAGTTVEALSKGLESYRAGQTGLLRLVWDNGDRTVLVRPELSGVTMGWRLTHTAQDELFAAIEGTAFHTKITLNRMAECGVPIRRVINGGGIPQRSDVLNRVYASAIGKPILVPESDVTSLGSAIFAFLAAGAFATIEEAQDALCPKYRVIEPVPEDVAIYEKLFGVFEKLYFGSELTSALADLSALSRG